MLDPASKTTQLGHRFSTIVTAEIFVRITPNGHIYKLKLSQKERQMRNRVT